MEESVEFHIRKLINDSGLLYSYAGADKSSWDDALVSLNYIPVTHSINNLEYMLAYSRGGGASVIDLSFTLGDQGKPAGVVPLFFQQREGRLTPGLDDGPMLPPLFCGSDPSQARMARKVLDLVIKICDFLKSPFPAFQISPFISGLSLASWQKVLLEWTDKVVEPLPVFNLSVNLQLSDEDIRSHFRKSYKPLVNKSLKQWTFGIDRSGDEEAWQEFRDLHAQVAGRVTRAKDTWETQRSAVASGLGFLVTMRDMRGRMVGAAFYRCSRDEGRYDSAAYDRNLFKEPLGHGAQWTAIQEMKSRKLKWYILGPWTRGHASQKELSIADFKKGFATDIVPGFCLQVG